MWKIFRCKRGEERWLIPGEHAKGDVVLPSEKGIETLINGIRNALSSDIPGTGTRIIEYEKKVVVQNHREIGSFYFYKKFLEINKTPKYYSKSLVRFIDSHSQTSFLHKILYKIAKISTNSVLEGFPREVIDIMMDTCNKNMYGVKCHNKSPRFSINTYKCKPTKEVVKVFNALECYT